MPGRVAAAIAVFAAGATRHAVATTTTCTPEPSPTYDLLPAGVTGQADLSTMACASAISAEEVRRGKSAFSSWLHMEGIYARNCPDPDCPDPRAETGCDCNACNDRR